MPTAPVLIGTEPPNPSDPMQSIPSTSAPDQTSTSTAEECTTSSSVASCLVKVFILTEYFTLDSGLPTSTIETITETNCVTYMKCDAQPTTTTTTTSSSTSEQPSPTCTTPLIVPEYEVQFDNVRYFVPLCADPVQTLWRADGISFTISCTGITMFTGEFIPMPADISSDQGCQVTSDGVSACFTKRFPSWNSSNHGVIIPTDDQNRFANLSAIADALTVVSGTGTSGASQGLTYLGCVTQSAMSQVAAYYFDMVQQQQENVTSDGSKVSMFLDIMSSLSYNVTDSTSQWIDEVDEALQNLACHIEKSDDQSSQVARVLAKQSTLHSGLNTLASIEGDASKGTEEPLLALVTNLFESYLMYIGMNSTIIEGWTQSWRLCNTDFDYPHLQDPTSVKPNQDDVDNWYPRYSFYTNPGTTIDQLRAVEHALGENGTELTTVDHNPDLVQGFLVELNILQATLPLVMPFVNSSEKLVWYGEKSADDDIDRLGGLPTFRNSRRLVGADSVSFSRNSSSSNIGDKSNFDTEDWDPTSYPTPNAEARTTAEGDLYEGSCE